MRWAMADGPRGGVVVRPVDAAGNPQGPEHTYPHPAHALRHHPTADRWIWSSTAAFYPRLLDAGETVPRCHDIEAAEAILLGHEGMWGLPRSLAAAWARLRGLPVPKDPPPRSFAGEPEPTLFDAAPARPHGTDDLPALLAVHAAQQDRVAASAHPHRLRLLLAAESAGMLVAAEMHHAGLPWRADVHDALLTELLGGRYPGGLEPPRLAALADDVSRAFGERVRPDLPAEVVRAFRKAGVRITSTRKWELQDIDHPAVAPLLEYKKLYRLHTAHGWSWLQTWVHDGRFRPGYLPGGAMSGRWTTHGGGALQIPRVVRRAVVADEGWRLVVADADQMEPRVLAAVSGDAGLMAAADGTRDLYEALAARAFAGGRAEAKLALLGAIYGQTSGDALTYLADLRRRFPAAVAYVDEAARAGEEGRLVRSHLGRTCAPSDAADDGEAGLPQEDDGGGATARGGAAARARGRFTRNFVVQASAAEWALCLLAALRQELAGMRAEPVFFQHDEVIVHCPAAEAPAVEKALTTASARAAEVMFGETPVVFSFTTAVVECYADAK
ncbi:bifunctional 3'-5' exonuclease/DNA polymerase [Streptomyces sp. CMB-StM0423]|uniref:bifunctional 3'-5' exonuclease/DNA polymerase n=1 Tax=Streptomyces sp. CMB-StM0423 TaxID=2059884 RepID=UPI000C70C167|nr:bifunctional 3'-5' exonuclease/DNA polymerase [Streptomyces sp. CMB-StM0423]AUH44126.1 bifunctional 3'-5' exonuclease/DNA polymerase [Streptomyces sp. CMB-StM0423]